jgi:hypothetical protein
MALQLGALRDALLAANIPPEKAAAAAEEVAGYENRLTRLTTLVQVAIGILVIVLSSQAGLWMELGKLNGTVTRLDVQLTQIGTKIDQLTRTH